MVCICEVIVGGDSKGVVWCVCWEIDFENPMYVECGDDKFPDNKFFKGWDYIQLMYILQEVWSSFKHGNIAFPACVGEIVNTAWVDKLLWLEVRWLYGVAHQSMKELDRWLEVLASLAISWTSNGSSLDLSLWRC